MKMRRKRYCCMYMMCEFSENVLLRCCCCLLLLLHVFLFLVHTAVYSPLQAYKRA